MAGTARWSRRSRSFGQSGIIKAINAYHSEHFTSLVVCSRLKHEYLSQEARLALPTAVVVQPLQAEQVTAYLKGIGKPMAAVRAALRTNPTFQRIITTPLMLNVVILAYRDKAIKDLPSLGSAEQQQHQIFDRYVERMLARPVTQGAFKPQQIQYWLTWLAHVMSSSISLNSISTPPTDLAPIETVPGEIFLARRAGLRADPRAVLRAVRRAGPRTGLGLLLGLFYGLVSGLVGGLIFGLVYWKTMSDKIHLTDVLTWSWKKFWQRLVLGLVYGLVYGLVLGLIGGLVGGLLVVPAKQLPFTVGNPFVSSLVFGLVSGLLAGWSTGCSSG